MLLPTTLIFGTLAVVLFVAWWVNTPSRICQDSSGKTVLELCNFRNYGYVHYSSLKSSWDDEIPAAHHISVHRANDSRQWYLWVGAKVLMSPPDKGRYVKVIFRGAKEAPLVLGPKAKESPSHISNLAPGQFGWVHPHWFFTHEGSYRLRDRAQVHRSPRSGLIRVAYTVTSRVSFRITPEKPSSYLPKVSSQRGSLAESYSVFLTGGGWGEDQALDEKPKEPELPPTLFDHLMED